MTRIPAWRRYLRFWRSNVADDVEDELRFHVEMRVDEYVARGMTEDEARGAVIARLGNVDAARAECIALGHVRERHARRADFFDGLHSDVRYALRALARAPGWTAVALLTIALGVGATTTVFSVADALLLRPLAYRDASRVFVVRREFTVGRERVPDAIPVAAVRAWREDARTIDGVAPFSSAAGRFGTDPDAPMVVGGLIDAGFLAFTGARPVIGRNFTAEELTPTGATPILLAEHFWRRQYGGSADVLGTVVHVGGRPRTIVGVAPASLAIPNLNVGRIDVWVPLDLGPTERVGGVAVRLRPGVSVEAATQELEAIFARLHLDLPRFGTAVPPIRLTRPQDGLRFRNTLAMLTGAVGLLLLVACTNVAHLLLARGAARQRELAVRHALGAARSRLLRQLVTESVVLAVLGGALALGVVWAALHLLEAARPADLVALTHVSTDRGVVSIASVLAIATGLVIGLLAALRSAHRDLGLSLRIGTSSASLAGRRLRASLVVGEVALSATLLVGALLLIHAVFDLQRTDLGFDPRGLYTLSFRVKETDAGLNRALAALLRERAASIPGVEGVTVGSSGSFFTFLSVFETPERPVASAAPGATDLRLAAPDYFSVMRLPFVSGRTFDDGSAARNEVIISRTLAHELWPDGVALGRRFRSAVQRPGTPVERWQTVIGVVSDVVGHSLIDGTARPAIFRPLDWKAGGDLTLIVRLRDRDPTALLKQLATTIRPDGPMPVIENVRERIDRSLAQPRFTMLILMTFAAVGVLLAAIGLFGVISYSVGQRTREIGVRLAFGATRRSIAGLVIGDGIRLALLGIGLGLLGSVAATRLIQNVLYGVPRLDPFSFGVGAAFMLVVSVAACVAPMLRATSVDPVVALRVE